MFILVSPQPCCESGVTKLLRLAFCVRMREISRYQSGCIRGVRVNSKQRVRAVLDKAPVDRLPTSVWGHDFLREWSAEDLVAQTVETQRRYGYDFVKINPRWTLFAEPWGNTYEPPSEQRFPRLKEKIVQRAEDLQTIPRITPDHPVFAEHVEAVGLVVAEIGGEVDCLATLFSPLAVLGLLSGNVGQPLLSYLDTNPDDAHQALDHITDTLTAHAQALVAAGASGIFFAPLPWTSLDMCPDDVYQAFGVPYDFRVLDGVSQAPFNMLHVCGNNIDLARFYDYPVQVLNWDNFGEGNPSSAEVARDSGKVVAGGMLNGA